MKNGIQIDGVLHELGAQAIKVKELETELAHNKNAIRAALRGIEASIYRLPTTLDGALTIGGRMTNLNESHRGEIL